MDENKQTNKQNKTPNMQFRILKRYNDKKNIKITKLTK